MKRPSSRFRHSKRSGDIRKDLTPEQLAGIGSVTLAYNEAEILIDILLSLSLGLLSYVAHEITSRINGIDGKIALAKIGMNYVNADETTMRLLGETLGDGGFSLYKKYRDAVIHARVLDAPQAIAISPAKRGKTDEVLLTAKALDGLYDRLVLVRLELIEACNVAIRLYTEHRFKPLRAAAGVPSQYQEVTDRLAELADLPKRQYEQEIQEALTRYREHQKRRLSLTPLPEFPPEPANPPASEGTDALPGPTGS
jgi:hypothetical protein